jgi:hypothetical protein
VTLALPRHQAVCMGTMEYYGNALYLHTRRHPLIIIIFVLSALTHLLRLGSSLLKITRGLLCSLETFFHIWLLLPYLLSLTPTASHLFILLIFAVIEIPPLIHGSSYPAVSGPSESAAVVTHGSLSGHIQRSVDHHQSTIFRSVVWSHGRS